MNVVMRNYAAIFDFDGVCVNSEEIATRICRKALKDAGLEYSDEVYAHRIAGVPHDVFEANVQSDYLKRYERKLSKDFFSAIHSLCREAEDKDIEPIPGVEYVFNALNRSRIRNGLASNGYLKDIQRKLKRAHLDGLVLPDHISSIECVEHPKPAPDLPLHAMRRLGITNPNRCAFTDDNVLGAMAGRAASMHTIGFNQGSHRTATYGDQLKQAGANVVCTDMAGVLETIFKKAGLPATNVRYNFPANIKFALS